MAKLKKHMQPTEWAWWVGSSEEWYDRGAFATRDQAIKEARGYGGINYITRARTHPVKLASFFELEDFLGWINDCARFDDISSGESDYNPLEHVPDSVLSELQDQIKMTIDMWQDENEIRIQGDLFTEQTNKERLEF